MRVVIEINSCVDCPFKEHIYEQGFCGEFCSLMSFTKIEKDGIRNDCPLKSNKAYIINRHYAEECEEIYCSNCGEIIQGDENYCPWCGIELEVEQ